MFPNARKGIKKLFLAEILTIVAAVIGFVATIVTAIPPVRDSLPGAIVLASFAIVALLLLVLAFLLHMFGLGQGGRDSGHFRVAFWAVIFAIVFSIGAELCKAIPGVRDFAWISGALETLSKVINAFVIIYVISGISSLAVAIGRDDVAAKGTIMIWIILGLYLLTAILGLVSSFFTAEAFVILFGILSIGAAVVEIVIYVTYLLFLRKATKIF